MYKRQLNGFELDERAINVNEARPKAERSDRGGYGANQGGGYGRKMCIRDSVRGDHRLKSLRTADADLPCRTLYDGRYLGRLQPDDYDPGSLSHR